MPAVANQATEPFADLNAIIQVIQRITVPPIKQTLRNLNDSPLIPGYVSTQGLKRELVDRLVDHFSTLKAKNMVNEYRESRRIFEEQYGVKISSRPTGVAANNSANFHYSPRPGASSSNPNVHPYYLPSKYSGTPQGYGHASSSSMAGGPVVHHPARRAHFRSTPFLQVKEWVGPIVECPEAPSAQARSIAPLNFLLTAAYLELLRRPTAVHQLRLFCTTRSYYDAALNASHPAPVEFPITCEVKVNNVNLSVNLKGKKTAAKVLAPNINKDNALYFGGQNNKIELVYHNTAQRYILGVAICEVRNADTLARRIRRERFREKKEVLGAMRRAAEDDDIEMGDVSMGLKCPLSYMRLNNPIRSSVCVHMQCFDALSFFSINEQTPSWQCPICFKSINPDSLFLDGFVQDILDKVPEEEETVLIDSEGRWHTPNNKYSSDATEERTATATPMREGERQSTAFEPVPPQANLSNGNLKEESSPPLVAPTKARVEVFEIDDDESPRPAHKTVDARSSPHLHSLPLTSVMHNGGHNGSGNGSGSGNGNGNGSGSRATEPSSPHRDRPFTGQVQPQPSLTGAATNKPQAEVIDLTLSDSEDESSHEPPINDTPAHAVQRARLADQPPVFPSHAATQAVSSHGTYDARSLSRNGDNTPRPSEVSSTQRPVEGTVISASAPATDVPQARPPRRSNSYLEEDNDGDDSGPVRRHHKRGRHDLGSYAEEEQDESSAGNESEEALQEDERSGLAIGV